MGDDANIADLMARADRLQERSKELQAASEVAQAHAKAAIRRGMELVGQEADSLDRDGPDDES